MADLLYNIYTNAVERERSVTQICYEKIKECIQFIQDKYSKDGLKTSDAIDFDISGNKCAYVYRYAISHSCLVTKTLQDFRVNCRDKYLEWLYHITCDQTFNICSIGAGPGTDIVGVIMFFQRHSVRPLSGIKINCTLIDKYATWSNMFGTILKVLNEQNIINHLFDLSTKYLTEDLLNHLSEKVQQSIKCANLVTMVKFISAVSSDERCFELLKTVFRIMKPGALFLYIDNSGGKTYNIMFDAAQTTGLKILFGPVRHANFNLSHCLKSKKKNIINDIKLVGSSPKENAKVSVVIWQKPQELRLTSSPIWNFATNQNYYRNDNSMSPILSDRAMFHHRNDFRYSDNMQQSYYNSSYDYPSYERLSFYESSNEYPRNYLNNSWQRYPRMNESIFENNNFRNDNANISHNFNYSRDFSPVTEHQSSWYRNQLNYDNQNYANKFTNDFINFDDDFSKISNNSPQLCQSFNSRSFESFKENFLGYPEYQTIPESRKRKVLIPITANKRRRI